MGNGNRNRSGRRLGEGARTKGGGKDGKDEPEEPNKAYVGYP